MKRGIVKRIFVVLQTFALAVGSLLFGSAQSLASASGKIIALNDFKNGAIIADHSYATLSKLKNIPQEWIDKAKTELHIVYGHTSHGSQVTDGMTGLVKFLGSTYAWNSGGSSGALDLRNTPGSFTTDLGNDSWATITRNYLKTNSTINVVMWSWCGQVSGASESYINSYLKTMSRLEEDYPQVRFVYMTGHTDGTGVSGNLHIRNEQIRKYCRENNKILFDFANIESYDPDGNGYLDKAVNDGCHYDSDGNGSRDKNWAEIWQNAHKLNEDWFHCSSAHSQPLTANMKAYAAWHLWARIAGWDGTSDTPVQEETVPVLAAIGHKTVSEGTKVSFSVSATPVGTKSLTFSASASPKGALPTGAYFDADTHTFIWTPTYTQSGVHTLRFTVSDGENTDYEDITITVFDKQQGGGASAFNQIQAEDYTDMSGVAVENCAEGGKNVGWIQNGDYIVFHGINFGEGVDSFSARVSSEASGGKIELRLDSETGPIIGSCNASATGGWQEWKTATCPVSVTTGIHDLYLVFKANGTGVDYLMNINWFQFTEAKSNNTVTVTPASKAGLSTALADKIGNRPFVNIVIHKNVTLAGRIIYGKAELNYDPTAEELQTPDNIAVSYISQDGRERAVPSGKYNPVSGMVSFTPSLSGRYAVTFEAKTFQDIQDAYARSSIEALASKGFYNWIDGEKFNPGRDITRGEFLYLLVTALDLHAEINGSFSDVTSNDFYYEAARIAKKLGISNGIGNNKLGANDAITRQDMATLVVRALKVADRNYPLGSTTALETFSDVNKVSDYAKESLSTLVNASVIVGYNNSLYPLGNFDMQQAATVIYRLYKEAQ